VAFGENPKHNDNPATRMGAVSMLRQALYDAKVNYDIKNEVLKKVLNREIPIHAHAHRASDIIAAIKIAEEFDIDVKIVHATEGYKIADTLKSKKIDVMIGPLICDRGKQELKNYDDKNAAVLEEKGVHTAIVSDHPELPSKYLLLSAQLAVKNGMSEAAALKSITADAAEILNMGDFLGKISENYNAEILIFDKNPIDFTSKITNIFIENENYTKR
jgi:imidazolonepropionase-like amidohydrolase